MPGSGDRRCQRGQPSAASSATLPTASSRTRPSGSAGITSRSTWDTPSGHGPGRISAGSLMYPARRRHGCPTRQSAGPVPATPCTGPKPPPLQLDARADRHLQRLAEFLGLPHRHDRQAPAAGCYLSPAATERLLRDLAVRRPVYSNLATALRTAAVAALVSDTGRNVPELARLKVADLHLDDDPHVELGDESCPISDPAVQILSRWLSARAAIIADLEGSDPGYLWIPVNPGVPEAAASPSSQDHACGRPYPPRRPPQPRQPGSRHPLAPRRVPRAGSPSRPVRKPVQPSARTAGATTGAAEASPGPT